MRRKRVLLLGLFLFLTAAGVWGAMALRARPDPLLVDYPDCPFHPASAEFPRIISVAEPPPKEEKEAYDKYWDDRKAVSKYLFEDGAIAKEQADAREALKLADKDHQYAKARELARKALAEDPNSIAGRFTMAIIEEESDQNFPRALHMYRKLRRQFHDRGLENPDDADAREWYIRVALQEYYLLGRMGRDLEVLRCVDLLEAAYQPLPIRRIWALIRLRRLDEAREALDRAEKAGSSKKSLANNRLSIEERAHRRAEAYEAGKSATAISPDSAVIWSNFSGACTSDFRFAEGFQALIKSAACKRVDFSGSPYTYLTSQFSARNQMSEAWDSLKKAQQQRRDRDAYTLISDQDTFASAVAAFLGRLGRTQDAIRFARLPIDRPGRTGTKSADAREFEFSHAEALRDLLASRLEELGEESAATGGSPLDGLSERTALEFELLGRDKQIQKILADDEFLVFVMRPYLPGAPSSTPASLVDLLPAGVAVEALRRAREAETHPAAIAYFDAADAVLAWRQGRAEEARTLAKKALEGLAPDYELDARAQMAAIAAEAGRKLGDQAEALKYYDRMLRDAPVTFRDMRVAIPVKIADDGSEAATQLARRISRSPRFREDAEGFTLNLKVVKGRLTFALYRLNDARHCEDGVPDGDDAQAVAASACRRLHQRVMSPVLDLTPTQINSLETALFAAPASKESNRILGLAGSKGE